MNANYLRNISLLSFAFLAAISFLPIAIPALKYMQQPNLAYIVDLLYDDAYYYLQIAYNIANNSSSSFDGTTETNGYQPLWLLILTFLSILTGKNKILLFWSATVLAHILSLYPIWKAKTLVKNNELLKLYTTLLMGFIILRFHVTFSEGLEAVLTPFF